MKRSVFLVTPAMMLAGLLLLGLSDTKAYIAETSVSNNEVTSSGSKASNSSATATITMYSLPDE